MKHDVTSSMFRDICWKSCFKFAVFQSGGYQYEEQTQYQLRSLIMGTHD